MKKVVAIQQDITIVNLSSFDAKTRDDIVYVYSPEFSGNASKLLVGFELVNRPMIKFLEANCGTDALKDWKETVSGIPAEAYIDMVN